MYAKLYVLDMPGPVESDLGWGPSRGVGRALPETRPALYMKPYWGPRRPDPGVSQNIHCVYYFLQFSRETTHEYKIIRGR